MSANIETSAIEGFFRKKSIFITGATGFLGKQLVEKLVRSCPGREQRQREKRTIMNFQYELFRCRTYLSSCSTETRSEHRRSNERFAIKFGKISF